MKYQLETIPVWDAFREDTECPFCLLRGKAEQRYLDYYLGNSAMNPETRVELNKTGFCPEHFSMLLKKRSPQHLGLITHTHMQDWRADLERRFPSSGGKSLFSKKESAVGVYADHIAQRNADCLICDRIEQTLKRYSFTTCWLYKKDEEGFRAFMSESKGFCQPHEADLLRMGEEVLKSSEMEGFLASVKDLQARNFSRLEEELHHFTQMFKAENSAKDWGTAEDAHYRVIQKLSGRFTEH